MPYFKTYNPKEDDIKDLYEADSLARIVYDSVKYYQNVAKSDAERANQTYEEVKAQVVNEYEEENKRLKERDRLVWLCFATTKEQESYKKFTEKHRPCRLKTRNNGGRIPYLIPETTGFGKGLTVVCPICNEQENITDFGAW